VRAQDRIQEQAHGFTEAIDEQSRALDRESPAALKNRDAILSWLDAIEASTIAQLANGDSIQDVNADMQAHVSELRRVAIAAGFTDSEVDDLIATYLNVPETVDTAIRLSGDQIAMQKIEAMLLEMDDLDEGVVAEVATILESDGAWAAFYHLRDTINNSTGTFRVRVRVTNPNIVIPSGRGGGGTRVVAVAQGGYFDKPTFPMLGGEDGPEVMLPLTKPGRLAALLGMPEVFGPVAAAMSKLVPGSAMSGLGGVGGYSGGTSNMYVTVNMPPGSNGQDVVNALRKYQRRAGPLPLAVR
jgi:hypothetical protein